MPSPPNPDPIEEIHYRIQFLFEEPHGRLWSTERDFMVPTMDSTRAFAEDLNSTLGLDYTTWTEFARRVFAARVLPSDVLNRRVFVTHPPQYLQRRHASSTQ